MESYGSLLKKAREDKKLEIEQVVRETSIARQYIDGLESEDNDVFPGEPYLIGFLKNYCDYLGIDSEELIKLYHAKKIQEAPPPVELLEHKKSKFLVPLIVIASAAVVLGIGAYLFFAVFNVPEVQKQKALTLAETAKTHEYAFSGKLETHRLYIGDQIIVPDPSGKGNIVLTVSNTLGSFTVETPSGSQVIELSEERELDINGDGKHDFILYVSDVSSNDASHGAEVRMLAKDPDAFTGVVVSADSSDMEEPDVSNEVPVITSVKDGTKQQVIHEDTRAYPFTVNVSFRGSCLFRYRSDRKEAVEGYYTNGEVVNVSSSNGIRLWMSNVNSLKIQVIAGLSSYSLEVGKAGQVQVEDIKWVRDTDGMYRLVIMELD